MKISLSLLLIVFALYQISQFPARERERKSRITELKYMQSRLETTAWQLDMEVRLMQMEFERRFNKKPFERWKNISCIYPGKSFPDYQPLKNSDHGRN